MTRTRTALLVPTVLAAALLTGCTGAAAPVASESSAQAPAPTASADPTTAPEVPAAASCAAIDTTEPTVDGTTLGTCLSDALHAIGTMRARQTTGGETQDADIRLRPDVAIHGTSPSREVIFVDDVTYSNDGSGWVEGDATSDDPAEMIVGGAGELLVALFTGDVLKQSIAACPVWNIETAAQKLTLPDDTVVDTRVFTCAAPFESFGATISPMHVWIGADWTPYGYASTATGYGQAVEGSSYYYDHGVALDITAPR